MEDVLESARQWQARLLNVKKLIYNEHLSCLTKRRPRFVTDSGGNCRLEQGYDMSPSHATVELCLLPYGQHLAKLVGNNVHGTALA